LTPPAKEAAPEVVERLADRAVDAVQEALQLPLGWDSETLPLLDYWLQSVSADDEEEFDRAACAAGAYFGEVVRRRLGGVWDLADATPDAWRVVLTTTISLHPVGMAAAAIGQAEAPGYDDSLAAPSVVLPMLKTALDSMADVTEDVYYSLGGRLDTLEHVHSVVHVLLQREAAKRKKAE